MTGTVFDIQRFSIHDGPGIRTTVFLKGCPLRCIWCHNPESYSSSRQLQFTPALCIGCGSCFSLCPEGAHVTVDDRHVILRDRCRLCFRCAEQCYSRALEVVGRETSPEEVVAEVLRDKPFYAQSGGGMTLGGGEPFAQPAFSLEILRLAKREGLDTCVETSGYGRQEDFLRAVPLVDLFLFDCKETDPTLHERFTGRPRDRIIECLRLLDEHGAGIVLRCPLVPGLNAREEHFRGIAELSRSLKGCRAVEVMGYHRLGESKVDRLGMGHEGRVPPGTPDMSDAELEGAVETLRRLGAVSPRRS